MNKSVFRHRSLCVLVILLSLLLSACKAANTPVQTAVPQESERVQASITQSIAETDAGIGSEQPLASRRTVQPADRPQKVLALSGSIAEIWLLAGGELAGVTRDAVTDRALDLPPDILQLGTVKDPNAELILESEPDLVLLSADLASHLQLADVLTAAGIKSYRAKVETLDEYCATLKDFCALTGRADAYQEHGLAVADQVAALLARCPQDTLAKPKTALFLRAFSTGVKAKAREHTVCTILEDCGVVNIADRPGFPLDELSLEAILEADPDIILVVPMGDEQAARVHLQQSMKDNPAWGSLTAIQQGRLIFLPKDLYHYKPNQRWGEAYAGLLKIFYPETFAQD